MLPARPLDSAADAGQDFHIAIWKTYVLGQVKRAREVMGSNASDRHLLARRMQYAHWHPSDPKFRVITGHLFRDWFNVPTPDGNHLAEPISKQTNTSRKMRRAKRNRMQNKATA